MIHGARNSTKGAEREAPCLHEKPGTTSTLVNDYKKLAYLYIHVSNFKNILYLQRKRWKLLPRPHGKRQKSKL